MVGHACPGPWADRGRGAGRTYLVFLRKQDGENPPRDVGVGGVGRAVLHVLVVVLDLEHDRFAVDLKHCAIMLLPRVVVVRKGVERPDGRRGFRDKVGAFLDKAARQIRLAAASGRAQFVV